MTKKIWMFWHDTDYPLLVQKCIKNILRLHPSYEITIMSLNTFKEYTGEPPPKFKGLGIQFKSDWIRTKVISVYGGFWIDASIYLCKPLHEWVPHDCDLYGMRQPGCKNQVENWFFYSPEDSFIVNDWLREYESSIQIGSHNYVRKIMRENGWTDGEDYCGGDYLFHQLALMNVIHSRDYKVIIGDYGFNYGPFDRRMKFIANTCILPNTFSDPLHKFRGVERSIFENYYVNYGIIHPNSIMGQLNIHTNKTSPLLYTLYISISLMVIYVTLRYIRG